MGTVFRSFLFLTILFILAISIIGFFLPREKQIVVEKEVSCSPEYVYQQVNELRNWEKWSPWYKLDPKMKLIYSESSAGNGAWYSWQGNDRVGKGKLSIVNINPLKRIDMLLNYNYEGDVNSGFDFEPTAKGTKVRWSIDAVGSNDSIFEKFFGGYQYLMMKFFITKDFSAGLQNLEDLCNNKNK